MLEWFNPFSLSHFGWITKAKSSKLNLASYKKLPLVTDGDLLRLIISTLRLETHFCGTKNTHIITNWFLEHVNEFPELQWPPQPPDLSPIQQLWDVVEREICIIDVQPTDLQQLRDAIMSIWSKVSEECFQHLVESMPRRIKAVLKAKGGPTLY